MSVMIFPHASIVYHMCATGDVFSQDDLKMKTT